MKTVSRSLLLMGLCLVPVLATAAPGSQEILVSPLGDDACSAEVDPICWEAPQALGGLDAGLAQDCGLESGPGAVEVAPASMERKPCKACQQQPWCACTYQGHPRVSCDPCCYQTYAGQICTS